jgi:hypothetical protein
LVFNDKPNTRLLIPLKFDPLHRSGSSIHHQASTAIIALYSGHAVAQLVEELRYEPEGRGFDSRWCHCNFSLT